MGIAHGSEQMWHRTEHGGSEASHLISEASIAMPFSQEWGSLVVCHQTTAQQLLQPVCQKDHTQEGKHGAELHV